METEGASRSTCTPPTLRASILTSASSATSRRARAEGFNKTYGIVHPMEQWETNRNVRVSPFHAREQALGAVFFETAGWERPWWYESNAGLLEEYGDRVMPREAEWESRWLRQRKRTIPRLGYRAEEGRRWRERGGGSAGNHGKAASGAPVAGRTSLVGMLRSSAVFAILPFPLDLACNASAPARSPSKLTTDRMNRAKC